MLLISGAISSNTFVFAGRKYFHLECRFCFKYSSLEITSLSGTFLEDEIIFVDASGGYSSTYTINRYTGNIVRVDEFGQGQRKERFGKCQEVSEKKF